jgi:hypothetical protein
VIDVVIARAPAVARGPLVMAARSGLFGAATEPELDRWTAALRSLTCARVAAFSLLEPGHVLVKSLCTRAGAAGADTRACEKRRSGALLVNADQGTGRRGAGYARVLRTPAAAPVARASDVVAGLGPRGGIAIERHRSLQRLLHDARHDGLTRLPNRTAIFEALDRALGRGGPEAPVAVLFVDLDGLEALNDTLGHDHADEMIREIGNRLVCAVRTTDFVGRFVYAMLLSMSPLGALLASRRELMTAGVV